MDFGCDLERDDESITRIAVDGDLELALPDGRFSVAARDGVGFVSQKDVSIVSAEVKVNAVEANVALQKATLVGKYLQTEFERIKSFATSFDGMFDRFSQRVKNSYRRVEGLDQVKAENVDYTAKKTMNLHGENAVMTARQLVKVDGDVPRKIVRGPYGSPGHVPQLIAVPRVLGVHTPRHCIDPVERHVLEPRHASGGPCT